MILALVIFVHRTERNKRREAFADIDCADISDCKTCAVADKCSWCPKLNLCIYTSSITSTDKNCNQMNVVNSSEGCSVNTLAPIKIDEPDSRTYKNDFYKNLPPGVYTADEVKYSNEDVMGSVTNMQNDLKNLRGEIPYIVSSSVENNIRQIVKGILAENYYIQGFEDIKNYRAV